MLYAYLLGVFFPISFDCLDSQVGGTEDVAIDRQVGKGAGRSTGYVWRFVLGMFVGKLVMK